MKKVIICLVMGMLIGILICSVVVVLYSTYNFIIVLIIQKHTELQSCSIMLLSLLVSWGLSSQLLWQSLAQKYKICSFLPSVKLALMMPDLQKN